MPSHLIPLQTNPFPLGLTLVATVGVAVPITAYLTSAGYINLTGGNANSMKNLIIQALPTNAGNIYVLNGGTAADLVNYSNVLAVLGPGQPFNAAAYSTGPITISNYKLDTDNAGSGAIASVYQS